jgi:hypothetical protein
VLCCSGIARHSDGVRTGRCATSRGVRCADTAAAEFLKQVEPLDPIKWLPQLRSRTMRLQDALYEKVTPANAKKRIESAMPARAPIVRYKNSHALEDIASGGRFFDWLKEQVQPAVAGSQPSSHHGWAAER